MLRFTGKASSAVEKKKKVAQLVSSQDCLTVDGEAFCNALKCLYWLAGPASCESLHSQLVVLRVCRQVV